MYIVKKPLKLLGKRRWPGDTIEEKDIPNVALLLREGYMSEIPDEISGVLESTGINIPVCGKEGSTEVVMSEDEVKSVFAMLQMSTSDVSDNIKGIQSTEVLTLIGACDNRKAVQSAVKTRLKDVIGE